MVETRAMKQAGQLVAGKAEKSDGKVVATRAAQRVVKKDRPMVDSWADWTVKLKVDMTVGRSADQWAE